MFDCGSLILDIQEADAMDGLIWAVGVYTCCFPWRCSV